MVKITAVHSGKPLDVSGRLIFTKCMTTLTDAQRLKQLYDTRVPKGMSQEEFGQTFGIGKQSMVSQYLNGICPLNYEVTAKFAKGLRCTIADISPEMARKLKVEILPVLGRVSVKAALALLFVLPPFLPQKAEAGLVTITKIIERSEYTLRNLWARIFGFWRRRVETS